MHNRTRFYLDSAIESCQDGNTDGSITLLIKAVEEIKPTDAPQPFLDLFGDIIATMGPRQVTEKTDRSLRDLANTLVKAFGPLGRISEIVGEYLEFLEAQSSSFNLIYWCEWLIKTEDQAGRVPGRAWVLAHVILGCNAGAENNLPEVLACLETVRAEEATLAKTSDLDVLQQYLELYESAFRVLMNPEYEDYAMELCRGLTDFAGKIRGRFSDSPIFILAYDLSAQKKSHFLRGTEAIQDYEIAEQACLESFGDESALLAGIRMNLGTLWKERGDFKRARVAYEGALSILENTADENLQEVQELREWLEELQDHQA